MNNHNKVGFSEERFVISSDLTNLTYSTAHFSETCSSRTRAHYIQCWLFVYIYMIWSIKYILQLINHDLMCVLDNNNGRNDTPQLSRSTKYDKLILTSDLPPPQQTPLSERTWTNKQIDSAVPVSVLLPLRQNDTLMAFRETRSNTQDIFITKQDGILRRNTSTKTSLYRGWLAESHWILVYVHIRRY